MAQPKFLTNPPIVEALVDFQASIPGNPATFNTLADELRDDFPRKELKHQVEGKIEFKDGKLVEPQIVSSSFVGVRVANKDETIFIHLQPDRFTLNNVKGYIGGDQLIDKALTRWKWLVERTKPEWVSRVALHYINRLDLPLKEGDEFEKYFQSPPSLPKGAPQAISEYLSHVVSQDAQRKAIAIVTQQLMRQHQKGKPITFKVALEVFRTGNFPVDVTALRDILDSLRELKNETFFSLLTEETVRIYE